MQWEAGNWSRQPWWREWPVPRVPRPGEFVPARLGEEGSAGVFVPPPGMDGGPGPSGASGKLRLLRLLWPKP